VLSLAAGGNFSLALLAGGTVVGWGNNQFGQLAPGPDPTFPPVQIGNLTGVKKLAAGNNHGLALCEDGTVWSWGRNNSGQLGVPTITQSTVPVHAGGLTGIVDIAAGGSDSLAVRADGSLLAWGDNAVGQLGSGTPAIGVNPTPTLVGSLADIVAVAAGGSHCLAVSADGDVWSWGYNNLGQLGSGTGARQTLPVPVANLSAMTRITGGYTHGCALRTDGSAWAWGWNTFGEFGTNGVPATSDFRLQTPSFTVQAAPSIVTPEIASGSDSGVGDHVIVLKSNGAVFGWGVNYAGQVGAGIPISTTSVLTPQQVSGLTATTANNTITTIATGSIHALAIAQSGIVWSWGNNSLRQLGNAGVPSPGNSTVPVQVGVLTSATAVAGGDFHSLAVQGGNVYAWGYNVYNQLGFVGANTSTPTLVAGLSSVTAVAAGIRYSVALKGDGTVWHWGQTLTGTFATPAQITGLTGIVAIASKGSHGLALDGSGTVWAWGKNDKGQLGDGTLTDRSAPIKVIDSGIVRISAGNIYSFALRSDGTALGWGDNSRGQLGIGSNDLSVTPILVTH
jgi:alpha-tubulin suppressor-like RCC1 family protein